MLLAAGLRLAVGSTGLGFSQVDYVQQLRIARLMTGATVGAALALAGVALQALLRNPLAEPYILGLSTGAAAGVMVQTACFFWLGFAIGPAYGGAAAGSVLSLFLVYALSRRGGVVDPLGLLLTGVILSTIGGAVILLFNAVAGPGNLRDDLIHWMMGELNESLGPGPKWVIGALTLLGFTRLFFLGAAMDRGSLSADEARTLGVRLERLRLELLLIGSLLAAGAVVLAGPVAFVGLVAPHLARLLVGPRHRGLVVMAPLIGASLVVLADVAGFAAGQVMGAGRLPIGVFTALIGGPVFLMLLRPKLGRASG